MDPSGILSRQSHQSQELQANTIAENTPKTNVNKRSLRKQVEQRVAEFILKQFDEHKAGIIAKGAISIMMAPASLLTGTINGIFTSAIVRNILMNKYQFPDALGMGIIYSGTIVGCYLGLRFGVGLTKNLFSKLEKNG